MADGCSSNVSDPTYVCSTQSGSRTIIATYTSDTTTAVSTTTYKSSSMLHTSSSPSTSFDGVTPTAQTTTKEGSSLSTSEYTSSTSSKGSWMQPPYVSSLSATSSLPTSPTLTPTSDDSAVTLTSVSIVTVTTSVHGHWTTYTSHETYDYTTHVQTVTATVTVDRAEGIPESTVVGIAVATSSILLFVIAGMFLFWRRRHRGMLASSPSHIALSDSLHGGAEEALPPYAPSPNSGRANALLYTSKLDNAGVLPLPEYGYTALEPQIPEDSDLGCESKETSKENNHLMERRSIGVDECRF
ncbi:hypothetical protein C8Q76DRAFT_786248 [Earliella scabrosa]|nr:hypothetical protein C8Q76DRAFT_786248 [Earliella scabrosa]